jgi:hypothetical protein
MPPAGRVRSRTRSRPVTCTFTLRALGERAITITISVPVRRQTNQMVACAHPRREVPSPSSRSRSEPVCAGGAPALPVCSVRGSHVPCGRPPPQPGDLVSARLAEEDADVPFRLRVDALATFPRTEIGSLPLDRPGDPRVPVRNARGRPAQRPERVIGAGRTDGRPPDPPVSLRPPNPDRRATAPHPL